MIRIGSDWKLCGMEVGESEIPSRPDWFNTARTEASRLPRLALRHHHFYILLGETQY
jgi:hypothetical protein